MVTSDALGEHEIINLLRQRLTLMPQMPVPFGDDVSAVPIGNGEVAVLKTDMLVAKTDVPPKMSLYQAARKAIVMNVSDFASKGVQPTAALVALGLPKNLATKKAVTQIGDGLNTAAKEYGLHIVGGDTGQASDLIISVSMYGKAKQDSLMLRTGAKAGDILAVTGMFGKSAAGLRLLLDDGCKASSKVRVLEDAVLSPHARLAEGLALANCGYVSSSMDSSDGLAWSLHELMQMSGVGFAVETVPIAVEAAVFAEQNGMDAADLALYGGEEYELVLTVKPHKWALAKAAVESVGGNLIAIGKVTSEKQVTHLVNGKKLLLEPRGYEHFKTQL
ncbi:MAG: thiamine-phosphate kinase [Candidatus Bathyarchaeia archaeon]|jgi:thiamine-monophosphate kinase